MAPVEPQRFQSLSTAEAVLRYAADFIPSWAGAISIDLMPAVLVLILFAFFQRHLMNIYGGGSKG